jgi:hypothetical protein
MRLPAIVVVLSLLVPLGAPMQLPAQGTATATFGASTLIDNTAVTVGQLNDLNFGVVVPGTPSTIGPKAALAGKFVIHGLKNSEVRITFALPAVLSTGPASMPISFADDPVAGKFGCHRNQDQQNNCTTYTPSTPLVVRIRNNAPPQNTFYVWIGGKVSPAVGQQPGTYLGLVTMSAVYTGN